MAVANKICEKNEDGSYNYDEAQLAAAGCENNNTNQSSDLPIGLISPILGVAGLLAVVFIVYGGIQLTTSAGNASKAAKAKNTIMYAVIGLVIVMLACAIVSFIVKIV